MLTLEEVRELAAIGGPCLSVFGPLRDATAQVSLAETRLTTAAQQADLLLAERGCETAAREEFLRPVRKLAKNTEWAGRSGSFAVFRAPGFTKANFWPGILEPRVHLGEEFFLLPLLPGIQPRNLWILALSGKSIHLYRGSPQGIDELALPNDLPRSVAELGGFDQPDHDLEGRSSPGTANGQGAAIRFGTSSAQEAKWRYVHDFFRAIDRAIRPILAQTGDPLILAAVDRSQALYREVNTYQPLLDRAIHGSPDALGERWLHEQALEVLAAGTTQEASKAGREMDAAAGAKLLLTDPGTILNAARLGQIDRLFIGPRLRADEISVNSAALAVLRNSGRVICGEMPGAPEGVAAILRYREAGTAA